MQVFAWIKIESSFVKYAKYPEKNHSAIVHPKNDQFNATIHAVTQIQAYRTYAYFWLLQDNLVDSLPDKLFIQNMFLFSSCFFLV